VAEGNGQAGQAPLFSGICLGGPLAGQYEMDRCESDRHQQLGNAQAQLELDELAPITIFVGANNSGKSRLMRELFRIEKSEKVKLKSAGSSDEAIDIGSQVPDWSRSLPNLQRVTSERGWIAENDREELCQYYSAIDHKIGASKRMGTWGEAQSLEALKSALLQLNLVHPFRGLRQTRRCYVPIIRGMRPPLMLDLADQINTDDKDWYKLRTKSDYFSSSADLITRSGYGVQSIFTGLGLFSDLRQRLLARTQEIRDTVREYERFLSQKFFAGQDVTLIPVEEGKNDVVHIKIGNNDEYPIHDLGDGMQSLIICTYPIVTEPEPSSLFFLEEPDLCMHPSLQRTFLEVLKTYHRMKGHRFFLTTHSNHLLDLLEDNELVSIFSFSQIDSGSLLDCGQFNSGTDVSSTPPAPRFRIRISNLRDRQTLLELGVRPSATFLANATIWVEGISDCAYLRAYMEAFVQYLQTRGDADIKSLAARLDQYKEDRHYAFVEYSGGNLTHFRFTSEGTEENQEQANGSRVTSVPDLCATAIVLADGDVKQKAERESVFITQLKERFIVLPCKEIENMIPAALMKQQIKNDHTPPNRGTLDHIKLTSVCYDQFARSPEGIGQYLGETVGIDKYRGTPGNGGASGTLPTTYKTRWRSETKGIPSLVREALKHESTSTQPDQKLEPEDPAEFGESDQIPQLPDLPDYLTLDIAWLCIRLYSHIAECNYDTATKEKLQQLQEFIERPTVAVHSPIDSADVTELITSSWPIKGAADRKCLLSSYLHSSDHP
jgi:hypothetical protein